MRDVFDGFGGATLWGFLKAILGSLFDGFEDVFGGQNT